MANFLSKVTIDGVKANIKDASLTVALNDEITARTNADTKLQDAIDAESSARAAAVLDLAGDIEDEAAARAAADTQLQNNINAAAAGTAEHVLTPEKSAKYTTYNIGAQNVDSKVLNRLDIVGTYTNYYMQSMCLLDNNILFGFARTSDNDASVLIETDITGETIYRRVAINLGHCNDLTYNPNKSEIYCAPMNYGTYSNKIVVIDSSSLSVKSAFDAGNAPFRCSYDRVNDLLYVENFDNILVVDPESFATIATLSKSVLSIDQTLNQGSFVYEGEYCPFASVFYNTASNNGFVIWEYYKGDVFLLPGNSKEELEGVDVLQDKYLLTAGRRSDQIYIMKFLISNTTSPFNYTNSGTGRILTGSHDCNQLTNGKWYKPYGGDAVANFPDNNRGGTVFQFTLGFDFAEQLAITDGGLIYFRRMNQAMAWDAWISLYDPRWLGNIDNVTCAGFVTTGASEIRFTVPVPQRVSRFNFSGSIVCRNVAGSIFANGTVGDTDSPYTLTVTLKQGVPTCILKKADGTAFSATNNTPVSVTFFGTSQ